MLTGLATRAELEAALPQLAAAMPPGSTLALLVLDVYRFARINERWGQRAGDAVLAELAARLRRQPQLELTARIGADSFALLLRGAAAADWRKAVEGLIHMLREPFEVAPGVQRKLSASVGCALYPQDASHVSRLLGLAEAALFSRSERELQRRGEQLDPYGTPAAANMAWLQRFIGPRLPRLSEELLHALHLLDAPPPDGAASSPARPVADLEPQLEHYVQMLLAPELRREQHRRHAMHMGRLQAALGVPPQVGVCALGCLYRRLAGLTQRIPTRLSERMLFLGTLMQRIEADLSFQHEGAEQLREELLERVHELAAAMQRTRRRADLLDVIVQSLQQMPFMAWCSAYTQDARGRFVLESQSAGHEAWRLRSPSGAFEDGQPLGDNSLARSWLRSDIEPGPDVAHAARNGRGWALQLLEHGVRSSVAVPVLDAAGHVLVVLKLYGQLPASLFGTALMRQPSAHTPTCGGTPNAACRRRAPARPVSIPVAWPRRAAAGPLRVRRVWPGRSACRIRVKEAARGACRRGLRAGEARPGPASSRGAGAGSSAGQRAGATRNRNFRGIPLNILRHNRSIRDRSANSRDHR